MKVKTFSIIGTPIAAVSIIAQLVCTASVFEIESCVHEHIRPTSLPVNDTYIKLQSILNPLPNISDQLSPQIIQEVLKASGVDFSKFEHNKHCKVECNTSPQATNITLN